MTIAVDFDGTIVENRYPALGKERPFAIETLKSLSRLGHRIILWTARSGDQLTEAVEFCRKRGLEFYAINSNYPEGALFGDRREDSSKVIADCYIDDRNLGGIPDWGTIYEMISGQKTGGRSHRHHKRSLFRRIFSPRRGR